MSGEGKEIKWNELTTMQQLAIAATGDGKQFNDPDLKRELEAMGLLGRSFHNVWLTDLGREVLSQSGIKNVQPIIGHNDISTTNR